MLKDTLTELMNNVTGDTIKKVNDKLYVAVSVTPDTSLLSNKDTYIIFPGNINPRYLFDSSYSPKTNSDFIDALEKGQTIVFEQIKLDNVGLLKIIDYITTHDEITIEDVTTEPITSTIINIHSDFKVYLTIQM